MKPKILLLAGEQSGVMYAERLAGILRDSPAEVRGYGDYGFSTSDLAVMGFWPVLRRLFYFIGVARTMKRAIREWRPDVVVTVDYPGLNLKLAAYAKGLGVPAVHIVCPQVWAWHRNRIPKVAAAVSELLCFFPFEPALFEGTGLEAKFIGHPLVKMMPKGGQSERAGGGEGRLLAVMPGSRIGEIQRILPRLLAAVRLLPKAGLRVVVPAANEMAEREIRRLAGDSRIEIRRGGAQELLQAADCAVVASGTATLEAALARCPTVLVYAVSPLLAWFARRVITGVKHIGIINVVAERCGFEPPMPELLQEAFTPEAVAGLLGVWLADGAERAAVAERLGRALAHLEADGEPLEIAAAEIMAKCRQG